MTARELDLLWDRLDKLDKKVDRLAWIVILAAFACGAPQVASQIISAVG